MQKPLDKRYRFLIQGILRGLLAFGILIAVLFILRHGLSESERIAWIEPLYERPRLILALFVGSELLFGFIPPELFMLWSMQTAYLGPYAKSIVIFSLISYAAGSINFFIGRSLHRFGWLNQTGKLFKKYQRLFETYGTQLVVVSAVSPIPFSLVSLLAGAGGLEPRKYLINSLYRFPRYFLYAYMLWRIEG